MNSVWRANELTFSVPVVAAPRVELDAAEVEETRARRAMEPRADRMGPSIFGTRCRPMYHESGTNTVLLNRRLAIA